MRGEALARVADALTEAARTHHEVATRAAADISAAAKVWRGVRSYPCP